LCSSEVCSWRITIPAELGSALQQATMFMLTVRRCPFSVALRPSPTVPAHYITGGIVIGNNNDEQKSAPLWQPAVAGFFND
jgi:hypothetical protein